ncbi:DUF3152 domain-containing protein [Thermoleophilia bacterium SCSIO 60948]|nr:DUF3152 domain-containing protein [Thermoleophilia bacterium SCSIO 60948]
MRTSPLLAIGLLVAVLAAGLLPRGAVEGADAQDTDCDPATELCLETRSPWAKPGVLTYRAPSLAAGELRVAVKRGERTRALGRIEPGSGDATTRSWRVTLPPSVDSGRATLVARVPESSLERRDRGRIVALIRNVELEIRKAGGGQRGVLSFRHRGPARVELGIQGRGAYPAERTETFASDRARRRVEGQGKSRVSVRLKGVKRRCKRYSKCEVDARGALSALSFNLRKASERKRIQTPPERPTGSLGFVSDPTPTAGSGSRSVRYAIFVERGVKIDRDGFARDVYDVLSDRRSWIRSGRLRVSGVGRSGAANTRIILASPNTVDRLCAPLPTNGYVSCTQGSSVILNLNRWRYAVPHFDSRLTYRRMLVNHEFGHRIGQGHRSCPGSGQRAPVMQQQTYGLDGCKANPWPKSGELGSVSGR